MKAENGILKKIMVAIVIALFMSILGWGTWVTHSSYSVTSLAADVIENKQDIQEERDDRNQQVQKEIGKVQTDVEKIKLKQDVMNDILIRIDERMKRNENK